MTIKQTGLLKGLLPLLLTVVLATCWPGTSAAGAAGAKGQLQSGKTTTAPVSIS